MANAPKYVVWSLFSAAWTLSSQCRTQFALRNVSCQGWPRLNSQPGHMHMICKNYPLRKCETGAAPARAMEWSLMGQWQSQQLQLLAGFGQNCPLSASGGGDQENGDLRLAEIAIWAVSPPKVVTRNYCSHLPKSRESMHHNYPHYDNYSKYTNTAHSMLVGSLMEWKWSWFVQLDLPCLTL